MPCSCGHIICDSCIIATTENSVCDDRSDRWRVNKLQPQPPILETIVLREQYMRELEAGFGIPRYVGERIGFKRPDVMALQELHAR